MIETLFCYTAAGLVLYKTISAIAQIGPRTFDGHPIKFLGFTLHHTLLSAGSLALALGLSIGGFMLLAGIVTMVLFDRRRGDRRKM